MLTGRRFTILLITFLFVVVGALLFARHRSTHQRADEQASFRLSDRLATVEVVQTIDGPRLYVGRGDHKILLTPDEFTARLAKLQQEKERGGTLFRVLDITGYGSIFWVTLGFFGQFLFTGRMVVQWLASERAGRSIVPNAFWWLSLLGSSLLIIYFSWRIDIVGILGQATGWVIYVRNLWLIQKTLLKESTAKT